MGRSSGHAHTTNSLIHEPHAGFADLSKGALCAGQSNRAGISFITDSDRNCTLRTAMFLMCYILQHNLSRIEEHKRPCVFLLRPCAAVREVSLSCSQYSPQSQCIFGSQGVLRDGVRQSQFANQKAEAHWMLSRYLQDNLISSLRDEEAAAALFNNNNPLPREQPRPDRDR